MNPSIKQKWIAALRSGKYRQGREALCQNDSYCCLGVLCELAFEEGIVVKEPDGTDNYQYGEKHGYQSAAFLPPAVQDWAEIDNHNPYVYLDGWRLSLVILNDDKRFDFETIAEIIDVNF